jgi:hypothetical protein
MKKTLLVIALVCAALGAVSAQEGADASKVPGASALSDAAPGLLNVNSYVSNFGFTKQEIDRGEIDCTNDYALVGLDNDEITYSKFVNLGKDVDLVDTPLEFALLSYYSQPVVNIRPIEAKSALPVNKTSELKLGSAVLKELSELKFLDPNNRDAVGRYEGILTFITDRGNATRVEIESYYRQGIGSLVAEVVREELNEKRDGYIPAEVYANWKRIGAGDAQALMTDAITRFYLYPSQTTFRKLVEIYARQYHLSVEKDLFARTGRDTFNAILLALSASLEEKVGLTGLGLNVEVATLDPRYSVFSTPYGIDGGGY